MRLLKPFEKQFCKMQYRYLARFCPRAKNQICYTDTNRALLNHDVSLSNAQCGNYEQFTLTLFFEKFRESNGFTKVITK